MTEEQREARRRQDIEKLKSLTLMDDEFMSAFFRDDIEDTQFILRIILNQPKLIVKSVHAQHELKNLNGRSVRLDIHAVDTEGNETDIEIQQSESGAGFKRARYNSSLLDASILKQGHDPDELPETYVIFITRTDVIGLDEPIYPIERYILVNGKYIPVNDGAHTVFVNGAKSGSGTKLEKLMHDFSCARADDMYFPNLAAKMRHFKESEKGGGIMGSVVEEIKNDVRIEIALNLIDDGTLSLEDNAKYSGIPLEKIRELAEKRSA